MRAHTVVQLLIILAVAVGLAFLVIESADGWADWVVFGVVVLTAFGATLAVWNRQYPAATQKRRFTRDSSSRW